MNRSVGTEFIINFQKEDFNLCQELRD